MNINELHTAAKRALEDTRGSQKDVAEALGIDRSAVSRAVRETGLKHAAVQARIVSLLKGVPVQRRSTYKGAHVEHEWIVGP